MVKINCDKNETFLSLVNRLNEKFDINISRIYSSQFSSQIDKPLFPALKKHETIFDTIKRLAPRYTHPSFFV